MKTISRREEQILIAIWNLREAAYLLAIKKHLSKILNQNWSVGAVHKPLMKLEKAGFIDSRMGESTPTRGGRGKKIYQVTDLGRKILMELKKEHDALWGLFPELELTE